MSTDAEAQGGAEEPDSGEAEDKAKEMKALKKQSEDLEKKKVLDAAAAAKKKSFNPFTGNYHLPNGDVMFGDGSGKVGGVNNYH
jgi:hypothetical protein